MGNVVIEPPDLGPLVNSAEYDEAEHELKAIFLDLFATYLRTNERDLNVYGAAHLGSINLLQKRIQADGLAVFGDDTNAVQWLYRAWNARNPKRGMIFLKTYLQLLWPDGWTVDQMWQRKGVAYPTQLVARGLITDPDPTTNYYLTSRITVSIDDSSETGVSVPRVAPALQASLAARFLVEIQVLKRFANTLEVYDGAYAENIGFFHGNMAIRCALGNSLGVSDGAYVENFNFNHGDMAVTLAGKTPPLQTGAQVLALAAQLNQRLTQFPPGEITYFGWVFAATFADTDPYLTKVLNVQSRINTLLGL